MAMAGRHIRHDWQQFVLWEQKSVRTLCGRTSTWNATGIPGVSDQPAIIEVGDRKKYGWCTMCCVLAFNTAEAVVGDYTIDLHPYIRPMYVDVGNITQPQYEAYQARQRQHRRV